jgi:hypothetical protein
MRLDLFRGQGVPWPDFVEDVRFIETTGAGTCWVIDHYSYPPAPEAQLLDSWTAVNSSQRLTAGIVPCPGSARLPRLIRVRPNNGE